MTCSNISIICSGRSCVPSLRQLPTLATGLPENIPLYNIQEVPVNSPSLTDVVKQAEYYLTVKWKSETENAPRWEEWINAIKATSEILW